MFSRDTLRSLNKDGVYRSDVENVFLMEMMLDDQNDLMIENSDIDNFMPEIPMNLFEELHVSPGESLIDSLIESEENILY